MEKERKEIPRRKFLKLFVGVVGATVTTTLLPEVAGFPLLTNFGKTLDAIYLVHQKNKNIQGPFDAIVVLTAGNQTKGKRVEPSVHGKMRLIAGAQALREKLAPNLVIIGGKSTGEKPTAKEYLERKYQKNNGKFSKIPDRSLTTEEDSFNTATNIKALDLIMKNNGWKKVVLITNEYHLLRSTILALNFGINVTPVSAEDLLKQRDPRFGKVIDDVYKKDNMRLIKRKERAGVALLVFDPKAIAPTSLAGSRLK